MSTQHTVQTGDCIDSIAFRYGFFPATLWDHPENQELKTLRKDGNVLEPGDQVFVPDKRERQEERATEARHAFRRRGVPALLRIVFSRRLPPPDEPAGAGGKPHDPSAYEDTPPSEPEPEYEVLSDAPFVLVLEGVVTEGRSNADGQVEIPIVPDAQSGTITFYKGTPDEVSFDLDLGHLDSVESLSGQRSRLCNLGYPCAPGSAEPDDSFRDALRRFQSENGLDASGTADQATQDKLVELHGS